MNENEPEKVMDRASRMKNLREAVQRAKEETSKLGAVYEYLGVLEKELKEKAAEMTPDTGNGDNITDLTDGDETI